MSASRFAWSSRVRFVDTDASGRIHYQSIWRHFEAAEDEFLRHIGCPYGEIENRQTAFPRVRVECDYLAAIRYDDVLEIEVGVGRMGTSSFTLRFLASLDGRPAARGQIVIAAMDRQSQRSCPLPDRLVERLRPYAEPATGPG